MQRVGIQKQLGGLAPAIDRHHRWWLVVGLALLVLLAYGQTLGMYFWQDDAALVFKMQHPFPNAGSFGEGIFGVGAYKYLATPFIPLYSLFGLHPLPYFAVGIGMYFLLTLVVFWFVRELTQNNRIATSGAVLFGAGYFAQFAVFRLINSYQTNLSVILALITFGVLIWYYQTKRWWWYVLSVGLFAATLELVLVRSHGLIIPVIALEALFLISRWTTTDNSPRTTHKRGTQPDSSTSRLKSGALRMTIKKISESWFGQLVWSALRLLPFLSIYSAYYLSASNQSSGGALTSLVQTYWVEGHWENFLGLAASFGNMLIPDAIIRWFSELTGTSVGPTNWSHLLVFGLFLLLLWVTQWRLKFRTTFSIPAVFLGFGWLVMNITGARAQYLWYQDFATILAGTIGGLALVYFVCLALALWNRHRLLAIAILFALVWSIANYFGYFVLYPTSIMTSTTRYVMHSFVATVALWAILIELLAVEGRRTASDPIWLSTVITTTVIALLPLSLTIAAQQQWVEQKSQPTRAFYQAMQRLYPKLEYGALIWYDTKRDPAVEYAFGDFFSVGSMPDETALAIYYGTDRYDLKLANGANNFLSDSLHLKKPTRLLYTFYYDGKTLQDTTPQTRAALGGELNPIDLTFTNGGSGRPLASVGMSTPVLLDLDLTAMVKPAVDLHAPGGWEGAINELPAYFRYLTERDRLRRSLKVDVSSEWSGAEKEFLSDGNYEKGWAAHRTIWPVTKQAWAQLEQPVAQSISRVVWHNSHIIRTPTSYQIQTSLDGQTWTTVKDVSHAPDRPTGETVTEDFSPTLTRFVRMLITASSTGEAPGLIELEAVPTEFAKLDPILADKLTTDPLLGAQDDASQQALATYLESHKRIDITYQTDRAGHSQHDPITIQLADAKHYQVILPASGTELEEVRLVPPAYLGDVKVENAKISFPTLEKLNQLGFIERRSKN